MEEENGEDAIKLNENQNSKLLEEFEASMAKLQFKVVKEIEILMKSFQNEMETAVANFKQNFKAELIKNNPERTDNGKERCVSEDESNQSRNVSKTEENKDVPATAKGVSEDVLTEKFEVKTELETTPEKEQKVESNEQKSVNETNEKAKRFFSIHGPKPATGFRFNCKSSHVRKSIAKKVGSLLPTMVSQGSTYTQHYGQLPKPNNNENSFLSVSCASVNSPASHPRPVKILPKPRYYPYSCTSINVRNQRPTVCQSFIATPRPEQQNREQTTLNAQQNFPYENIVEQQQSLVKSPKILSQDELIRILKAAQGNSDGTNFNNSHTIISKTPLSETETVVTTPTMSDTTESVSAIDVSDDGRSKSQTRILSDQNINNRLENEISDLEVDTVFGSSFRGSKYCTKKQLMEAMRFAGRFGVAEASRKFNIPSQHLTYWYRKYGKPRVEQLPDYIDRDLIDHIIEYKKTHLNEHLGAYAVFILARQFLQRKYPGTLYEEGGWVTLKDRWIEGFIKRLVDREKVLISDEQALKQMNQLNPLIVLAAELMKAQNQNFEKERK